MKRNELHLPPATWKPKGITLCASPLNKNLTRPYSVDQIRADETKKYSIID